MSTVVEWVSPLEGTEFEPGVEHLATLPRASEPGAPTWGQILALTDSGPTSSPEDLTLLLVRFDHRFGLIATVHPESDRSCLRAMAKRFLIHAPSLDDWSEAYLQLDVRLTLTTATTMTEMVALFRATVER